MQKVGSTEYMGMRKRSEHIAKSLPKKKKEIESPHGLTLRIRPAKTLSSPLL